MRTRFSNLTQACVARNSTAASAASSPPNTTTLASTTVRTFAAIREVSTNKAKETRSALGPVLGVAIAKSRATASGSLFSCDSSTSRFSGSAAFKPKSSSNPCLYTATCFPETRSASATKPTLRARNANTGFSSYATSSQNSFVCENSRVNKSTRNARRKTSTSTAKSNKRYPTTWPSQHATNALPVDAVRSRVSVSLSATRL
mmetsp:Transcript_11518/g.38071  ORF Transcript_11518/g.38071 Transcript_11518/m.38071 type:complete len:203 (-) Transcript_11518:1480-2088(-)